MQNPKNALLENQFPAVIHFILFLVQSALVALMLLLCFPINTETTILLSKEQNDERSVATDDDPSVNSGQHCRS
jgi:hypothetical protein